jgi:hypothetical protein
MVSTIQLSLSVLLQEIYHDDIFTSFLSHLTCSDYSFASHTTFGNY